jgi:diguanylate cyclase (GGDEF)-like protein
VTSNTKTIDCRALLQRLPVGVLLIDRAGHVAFSNDLAYEILGYSANRDDWTFFGGTPLSPELREMEGAFWSAMADGAHPLDEEREFALGADAGPREVFVRLRRIQLGDESFGLLVVDDNARVKRTESALAAALGEAQQLAARDALTGLFNRRHVESVLPAELKRSQRLETPLSLMIIDLDHFKAVNDRYGHPMGDLVLVEVSRLLNRILRVGDTSARVGGEELCVVLPHSNAQAAERAAERLHRVIRALRFQEEPTLRITVSIGIATLPPAGPHIDFAAESKRLIARADEALYKAKRDGRDRTVAAE